MEREATVADIKRAIFRDAMKLIDIEKAIELHSAADVPANCGSDLRQKIKES